MIFLVNLIVFSSWPVSTFVSRAGNDSEECIKRVKLTTRPETSKKAKGKGQEITRFFKPVVKHDQTPSFKSPAKSSSSRRVVDEDDEIKDGDEHGAGVKRAKTEQ